MFCSQCGTDAADEYFCPNCKKQLRPLTLLKGPAIYNEHNEAIDVPNFFLLVLAFFVPLFGFIYYLSKVSTFPIRAKAYAIAALVSGAISSALAVISLLILLI